MATSPKQALHELIDRLDEAQARRLCRMLESRTDLNTVRAPEPLTESEVVLPRAVLPDEETADDLIAAVRAWRREGGLA